MAPLHPGRVTVYQIGELFGNAYKRAATSEIVANGFQATGLFPCDKNIFKLHDFPLSSAYKDATSVNHPALIKTSDQPSFSSATCNFSPFTSAEALRSSDISPVPSLNLKQNPRGGTAKKITSSPHKKIDEATQKKKIKQATKSKTSGCRMFFLVLQKNGREGFAGIQLRLTLHQIRTLTCVAVPFADDSTEEDEKQYADFVFRTGRFSEDHNGEH